jgi:hypothetical protein
MSAVPRKPCNIIRLSESEYLMRLDDEVDGVVDTRIRPGKLSKRARKKYLTLPRSPRNNAKKKT